MRKSDLDDRTTVELATPSGFHDSIDQDIAVGDDRSGLCPRFGVSGEFEELAEPNHVVADLDVFSLSHLASIGW